MECQRSEAAFGEGSIPSRSTVYGGCSSEAERRSVTANVVRSVLVRLAGTNSVKGTGGDY